MKNPENHANTEPQNHLEDRCSMLYRSDCLLPGSWTRLNRLQKFSRNAVSCGPRRVRLHILALLLVQGGNKTGPVRVKRATAIAPVVSCGQYLSSRPANMSAGENPDAWPVESSRLRYCRLFSETAAPTNDLRAFLTAPILGLFGLVARASGRGCLLASSRTTP